MNDVTDIKKIGVSRLTLGLIMSVASISGVVVWKAASVANQISDLEAKVAVIEQNTGTDSSVLAKLDEIEEGIVANASAIDSVRAARLDDLDRFAPSLIVEAIASDMNVLIEDVDEMKEIIASMAWVPSEFSTIWDRIYLAEEAIQSKTWGKDFYEYNE
tara:strand:+ start:326 stop:802 length:477 start_codon:yes stop_codon:yes gene_type:complete